MQSKKWTTPGALFAGYWSLAVCGAILLAPDGYPVTASAIWLIVGTVFSLGLGSMIGMTVSGRKVKNIEEKTKVSFKNIKKMLILFTGLGFLGVLVLLQSLGQGIGIFFSVSTLQNISASVSEARYNQGFVPPGIYNVLLSFNYAAAILGGMYRGLEKTKWAYVPFIPVLLSMAVMTTKAGILFALFLWLSGLLAMRVRLGKTEIKRKTILQLVCGAGVLSVLFILSSLLRYKMYNLSQLSLIYEKLTVYYVGFLSGFSQWFELSSYQSSDLGLGQYTLAGLYDVFGFQEKDLGIFSAAVPVGNYSTNIYTVFRYLLQDFGVAGSLLLLFCVGFIAGYCYKRTKQGSYITMPILIIFYTQLLFSNTTSIFGYNTILLAGFIVTIYIWKNAFSIKGNKNISPKFSLSNIEKRL